MTMTVEVWARIRAGRWVVAKMRDNREGCILEVGLLELFVYV